MSDLELIKTSFQSWYNKTKNNKMSIVINYSDEQTLTMKAYHKVTIAMVAVGIKDNFSYTIPLIMLSEHYNHGLMSETEAKEAMTKALLLEIFKYCSNKNIN